LHLKGATLLEDPILDVDASSPVITWTAPPSPDDGPARFTKKLFPERPGFGGGRSVQQPGVDGGEFEDAVTIGEVSVPDNLSLRPDQGELTKRILQRRVATKKSVNEWQYRTREIVSMRTKERGKARWR
jgi:hypothetical protein